MSGRWVTESAIFMVSGSLGQDFIEYENTLSQSGSTQVRPGDLVQCFQCKSPALICYYKTDDVIQDL